MWERWLRRGLLALSVVLASFLAYLLFTRSESASTARVMPPGGNEAADARIQGFTFTQTKGDIVQWKVEAQQARLYEDQKRAVLSHVQITLYGVQGKRAHVVGRRGNVGYRDQEFQCRQTGRLRSS